MATIRLYTTALEHQTTRTITSRRTRWNLDEHGDTVDLPEIIIGVKPFDETFGGLCEIAQVVEEDGQTATYKVTGGRTIVFSDEHVVSEYVLTALPDDAARIVEAVLAKPAALEPMPNPDPRAIELAEANLALEREGRDHAYRSNCTATFDRQMADKRVGLAERAVEHSRKGWT